MEGRAVQMGVSGAPKRHFGGQGGPVERSLVAKVVLPVGLVCKTYGNGPDPTGTRTRSEAKVYLYDKTYD